MSEAFDRGDRPGAYLEPILQHAGGARRGGAVRLVRAGGCSTLFGEVDRALRDRRDRTIFTPPVYIDDAFAAGDPAFAVAALREFVGICLAQQQVEVS